MYKDFYDKNCITFKRREVKHSEGGMSILIPFISKIIESLIVSWLSEFTKTLNVKTLHFSALTEKENI